MSFVLECCASILFLRWLPGMHPPAPSRAARPAPGPLQESSSESGLRRHETASALASAARRPRRPSSAPPHPPPGKRVRARDKPACRAGDCTKASPRHGPRTHGWRLAGSSIPGPCLSRCGAASYALPCHPSPLPEDPGAPPARRPPLCPHPRSASITAPPSHLAVAAGRRARSSRATASVSSAAPSLAHGGARELFEAALCSCAAPRGGRGPARRRPLPAVGPPLPRRAPRRPRLVS